MADPCRQTGFRAWRRFYFNHDSQAELGQSLEACSRVGMV